MDGSKLSESIFRPRNYTTACRGDSIIFLNHNAIQSTTWLIKFSDTPEEENFALGFNPNDAADETKLDPMAQVSLYNFITFL